MKIDSSKLIRNFILAIVICVFVYVFVKFFISFSIPFVIAYIISRTVRPISRKIRRISRRLDKPATAFLLIILTVIGYTLLRTSLLWLFDQLKAFIESLTERLAYQNDPINTFMNKLQEMGTRHPEFGNLLYYGIDSTNLGSILSETINSFLTNLASQIANIASKILLTIPGIAITIFITISASFYMSLDRGETKEFLLGIIPQKTINNVTKIKLYAVQSAKKYLKTYIIMMFIVFSLLYIGFTLLKVDFAFVKAFVIAIVDLLPVLGAGTVLIPWAIVDLVIGNGTQAVGLLILLLIITIVREILEPKIMGGYIGVPPLIALIFMYMGMKLFGVAGLILFPFLSSIILSVINHTEKEKTST